MTPRMEFQGQMSLGNTGLNKCDQQFSLYCQALRAFNLQVGSSSGCGMSLLYLMMELFYGKSSGVVGAGTYFGRGCSR